MQAIPRVQEADVRAEELRDPLGEDTHNPAPSIVHKYPDLFLGGRLEQARLRELHGLPVPPEAERLIRDAFAGDAPVHVDDLVTVWTVR